MAFKVIIARDFDHMSEVAAALVTDDIRRVIARQGKFVLGLATGNSPTGLYKHLAKAACSGAFDPAQIRSFNLDEYVGLPGENPQQRTLHPESYSFFMVQELFGLLPRKFSEVNVPWGALIDQNRLIAELDANPGDWTMQGADKGKAVVIGRNARSEYLRWIRAEILDGYAEKIARAGGIDLHVIGVGGRGHVAFHEAGIPFEGNGMLLVKLDDNTVENAVRDGHFPCREASPCYAISMGAELVYRARTVVLLANGPRKAEPVAESLLMEPDCAVPISYGHLLSRNGGTMIYVLDRAAASVVSAKAAEVRKRGIEIEDRSDGKPREKVEEIHFFRNPATNTLEWADAAQTPRDQ